MVLVLVLALSGAIGAFFAYKSRKSVNNKEFLVGNRKLQVRNRREDTELIVSARNTAEKKLSQPMESCLHQAR